MIIHTLGIKRSSKGLFHCPTASRTLAPLAYGILLFAAGILLSLDGHTTAAASPPAVIIKMIDTPPTFQPTKVTIKTGESVEWQTSATKSTMRPVIHLLLSARRILPT